MTRKHFFTALTLSSLMLILGGGHMMATEYCNQAAISNNSEWIQSLLFNNQFRESNQNDSGYHFFQEDTLRFTPGSTINFIGEPGFRDKSYGEYWRVWIDLNADGDYSDPGELVVDAGLYRGRIETSFDFNPEFNAQVSRIRVAMRYGKAADLCSTYNFGEVEEYPLIIGVSTEPKYCPPFNPFRISETTYQSVSLEWDRLVDSVEYEVFLNESFYYSGFSKEPIAHVYNILPNAEVFIRARGYCESTVSDWVEGSTTTPDDYLLCANSNAVSTFNWLEKITLNNITHQTGNNNGYLNETQEIFNLFFGTNTFSLEPGQLLDTRGIIPQLDRPLHFAIYCDLNRDGVLQFNECLFKTNDPVSGFQNGTLGIPDNIIPGRVKMRIMVSVDPISNACEAVNQGEVEDYEIQIGTNENLPSAISLDITQPIALKSANPSQTGNFHGVGYRAAQKWILFKREGSQLSKVLSHRYAINNQGENWSLESQLESGTYVLIVQYPDGQYTFHQHLIIDE